MAPDLILWCPLSVLTCQVVGYVDQYAQIHLVIPVAAVVAHLDRSSVQEMVVGDVKQEVSLTIDLKDNSPRLTPL